MRGSDLTLAISGAVLVFSVFMLVKLYMVPDLQITGLASSGTAISNVSVSKSFSITLSTNLSNGIQFGNVSTSVGINGTSNYDTPVSNSSYFVNTSSDATINVDLCINANADMEDSASADKIGLGNETYANASTTSPTVPDPGLQVALTTSGVKTGQDISPGVANYYRFWLNVTSSVPSGTYNNTITFTGVETGEAC
jgi:hypothetical protein